MITIDRHPKENDRLSIACPVCQKQHTVALIDYRHPAGAMCVCTGPSPHTQEAHLFYLRFDVTVHCQTRIVPFMQAIEALEEDATLLPNT